MSDKKKKSAKPAAPKKVKKESAPKEVKAVASAPSTAFEIESGIPIPARSRAAASAYPFGQLEVGQSFLIKSDVDRDLFIDEAEYNAAVRHQNRVVANRIGGAVRRFKKSNPDFVFVVRATPEGVRVWRVEG